MANRAMRRHGRKRSVAVAGVTLAAMLAVTRPGLPLSVYADPGNRYTWAKHDDLERSGGFYNAVASSASGQYLAAGVGDTYRSAHSSPLYLSDDYGATWTDVQDTIDEEIDNAWYSIDMTNDGQTIVAVSMQGYDSEGEDTDGRIYLSEDGGDSWSNITYPGVSDWRKVAISGDGKRIIALSDEQDEGSVSAYIYNNQTNTWSVEGIDESGLTNWYSAAISADGSKIVVGGDTNEYYDGGARLYLSEDSGDTWQTITPDTGSEIDYLYSDMSANGSKIASSLYGYDDDTNYYEGVYITENQGDSWTNVQPDAEFGLWNSVSVSRDGGTIAIMSYATGDVYFSKDDGDNWNIENPAQENGDEDKDWLVADFNANGSKMIISGGEEFYTGADESVDDETPVVDFGNAEDGKAVELTLPSGTTVTCRSAVKESGLSAQDVGYQYPVGLVDFCFSTEEESNDISLLFVTDLKPNEVVARKYDPSTGQYVTVPGVSITETTHNSQHALLVSYAIVDNGPLDLNPAVGEISDPVGLATAVGVPNTGLGSSRLR